MGGFEGGGRIVRRQILAIWKKLREVREAEKYCYKFGCKY